MPPIVYSFPYPKLALYKVPAIYKLISQDLRDRADKYHFFEIIGLCKDFAHQKAVFPKEIFDLILPSLDLRDFCSPDYEVLAIEAAENPLDNTSMFSLSGCVLFYFDLG